MATFEEMQALAQKRLKELEEGSGRKRTDPELEKRIVSLSFRTDRGETTSLDIRILPMPGSLDPFEQLSNHYLGKGHNFLCPKRNHGKPCHACDYASQLWQAVDDKCASLGIQRSDRERRSKLAEYKEARDVGASTSWYARVVIRGEEEKGAKWLRFNKTLYTQMLGFMGNRRIGNFADLEKGFDFTISYSKPENRSAFPKTTIAPIVSCPAFDDSDLQERVLSDLPGIEEFQSATNDEIAGYLREYISSKMSEGSVPGKVTTRGGAASVDLSSPTPPAGDGSDAEEAPTSTQEAFAKFMEKSE